MWKRKTKVPIEISFFPKNNESIKLTWGLHRNIPQAARVGLPRI